VVSDLVQRFGSLDFVNDNVDSFANRAFPRSGSFISFGAHRIYVSTAPNAGILQAVVVHVVLDPRAICVACGLRSDRTASCVEVMMASVYGTGKCASGTKDAPAKSGHMAKPALERQQNHADTSNAPPAPTLLQATIDKLATPVALDADVAAT
jgi:hypothetical protein